MAKQVRRSLSVEALEARTLFDGELDASWMGDGRMVGGESPFSDSGVTSLGIAPGGTPVGAGETPSWFNTVVSLDESGVGGVSGQIAPGQTLHQPDGWHVVEWERGITAYGA